MEKKKSGGGESAAISSSPFLPSSALCSLFSPSGFKQHRAPHRFLPHPSAGLFHGKVFSPRMTARTRNLKSRQGRSKIAHGFNRGLRAQTSPSPGGAKEIVGRNKRWRRRRRMSD